MTAIEPYYDPYDPSEVYGQRVRQWKIDGKVGQTFADVLAHVSIRQAAATEIMAGSVKAFIEMRQERVNDLGEALALLTETIGNMPSEGSPQERQAALDARFNEIMEKYGEEKIAVSGGTVTYADASRKQAEVRSLLDADANSLNQNIVQLQGLVSKRNNSFEVAAKVMEKYNATSRQTVGAFGS